MKLTAQLRAKELAEMKREGRLLQCLPASCQGETGGGELGAGGARGREEHRGSEWVPGDQGLCVRALSP